MEGGEGGRREEGEGRREDDGGRREEGGVRRVEGERIGGQERDVKKGTHYFE